MTIEVCRTCEGPTELNKRGHGLCQRCYNQEYYRNNKEKIKASAARWQLENPKKRRAIERRWYANLSLERRRKRNRRKDESRSEEQREKRRQAKKKYYHTNKHSKQMRATRRKSKMRRRARENNVVCTLTKKEWQELLEEYNHRCAYCGKRRNLEKDHVIPISKGGPTTKENIVPACFPCNRTKSDKVISASHLQSFQ